MEMRKSHDMSRSVFSQTTNYNLKCGQIRFKGQRRISFKKRVRSHKDSGREMSAIYFSDHMLQWIRRQTVVLEIQL